MGKLSSGCVLGLWLLMLAACGGGGGGGDGSGGGGAAGSSLTNPQPLAIGDRWIYRGSEGGYEQVTVESQRTVRGLSAVVVVSSSLEPQLAEREESLITRSGDALVELAVEGDPVSLALGDVALLPLPLPTQARAAVRLLDRSVASGYDFDEDGRPDAMSVTVDQEALAPETVTVPAGTFAGAARVRTVLKLVVTLSSSSSQVTSIITTDEWYAQDIGLLRDSVVTVTGASQTSRVRELTGYRVGGRRSDTAAPVVVDRSPALGSISTFFSSLTVQFDEPIDPASFGANGIVLSNAAGQPLAGTLTWVSSSRATLNLSGYPASGQYTVTVAATAADYWGNTRPAQQWSLVVDRSGPVVAGSTPTDGAVDVALNAAVEVEFDEPLDLATVNSNTLQLRDMARTEVATTLTVVNARTVRLTPLVPLEPGQSYILWVGLELHDVTGNGNANSTELRFRTVQGLFSYPMQVANGLGRGLASGDFTGDGLIDLLDFPDSFTAALRVHPGLSSGGLGPSRLVPLPDVVNCGNGGRLQAAEMNGDGRLQIVLTRSQDSCGIQVLAQAADGTLTVAAQLGTAGDGNIALADLDGDGRLDVVASRLFEETVTVWLQTAQGVFDQGRSFAGVSNARGQLRVGDVNGDGRPDIVMTSGQFDINRALTVLLQSADGRFDTRQSYPLAGEVGGTALALADMNGDGRVDVVVHSPRSTGVWIFRQAVDGTLEAPRVTASPFEGTEIVLQDLNGDGRPDIALKVHGVMVHLQAADGSFGAGYQYVGNANGSTMIAVDLNRDGRMDLVLGGPYVLSNLGAAAVPSSAQSVGKRALGRAAGATEPVGRFSRLARLPIAGRAAAGL